MKIAAIVPIGYLDRMGYQHVWYECVGSIASFADHVYLVSSVREPGAVFTQSNVTLISDEATWFARTPEGAEWFDAYRVMENVNSAAHLAASEGYDVGICLMVNNYVPDGTGKWLRACCEGMLLKGFAFEYLYRQDQLGDQLFSASVRLPFIVNLHLQYVRFSADSLEVGGSLGDLYMMERDDFRASDFEAIVDVQLEMTVDDLREKQTFIRNYRDLVPKRPAGWDWDYWRHYYVEKFRQKRRAGTVTDPTGLAIAAKSRPDFVSHEVLGELGI